ncbi:tRNA pseudouridine synthase A, partial [Nitrospirota bacterium]
PAQCAPPGSGRTDTGVHALGQVASFLTSSEHDIGTFQRALNAILPLDVRVRAAEDVDESFHPRKTARRKTYLYHIAAMPYVPPFFQRYVWHMPRELDIAAMRDASAFLKGEHDFRSFMASGSDVKSTVREILTLEINELDSLSLGAMNVPGRYICFEVEGTGFLRHMVRNIVGTLVEVGKGVMSVENVSEILSGLDRDNAGPTAPARGLVLEGVKY